MFGAVDAAVSWGRWLFCCCPSSVSVRETHFPPEDIGISSDSISIDVGGAGVGAAKAPSTARTRGRFVELEDKDLPTDRDREEFYDRYIMYLGAEGFAAKTHAVFSKSKTKELASIAYETSSYTTQAQSWLCCRRVPYGCRVCCSSRDARCAMVAGLCLGNLSAHAGVFCNLSSWVINVISGCFSGAANGSGTWLTLIDTTKRDDALALHIALEKFFLNLSLYLIQRHMQEYKSKLIAGNPIPHRTSLIPHAQNIQRNRVELIKAVLRYFPADAELDNKDSAILTPLLEAVEFILNRTLPKNRTLSNEITTIDSPSMAEYLELKTTHDTLATRVSAMETDLSTATAEREALKRENEALKARLITLEGMAEILRRDVDSIRLSRS